MKQTLVVNIFGGPGVGKSTLSAELFAILNRMGSHVEYVPEYAKDKVWEKSSCTLDNQIYIFGKQYHRIFRVMDKVDIIITDAPLLNSLMYNKLKGETKKILKL